MSAPAPATGAPFCPSTPTTRVDRQHSRPTIISETSRDSCGFVASGCKTLGIPGVVRPRRLLITFCVVSEAVRNEKRTGLSPRDATEASER